MDIQNPSRTLKYNSSDEPAGSFRPAKNQDPIFEMEPTAEDEEGTLISDTASDHRPSTEMPRGQAATRAIEERANRFKDKPQELANKLITICAKLPMKYVAITALAGLTLGVGAIILIVAAATLATGGAAAGALALVGLFSAVLVLSAGAVALGYGGASILFNMMSEDDFDTSEPAGPARHAPIQQRQPPPDSDREVEREEKGDGEIDGDGFERGPDNHLDLDESDLEIDEESFVQPPEFTSASPPSHTSQSADQAWIQQQRALIEQQQALIDQQQQQLKNLFGRAPLDQQQALIDQQQQQLKNLFGRAPLDQQQQIEQLNRQIADLYHLLAQHTPTSSSSSSAPPLAEPQQSYGTDYLERQNELLRQKDELFMQLQQMHAAPQRDQHAAVFAEAARVMVNPPPNKKLPKLEITPIKARMNLDQIKIAGTNLEEILGPLPLTTIELLMHYLIKLDQPSYQPKNPFTTETLARLDEIRINTGTTNVKLTQVLRERFSESERKLLRRKLTSKYGDQLQKKDNT